MNNDRKIKKQKMPSRCNISDCANNIIFSNSARNFSNPALSVKTAVDLGLIRNSQKILEIGSGNLRNLLYILKHISDVKLSAFDVEKTIIRYNDNYKKLLNSGGHVITKFPDGKKYDVIICTYVVETLCPKKRRMMCLYDMRRSLNIDGFLIASVRGIKGVIGSKYIRCLENEGWISPLNTFIKPYSIKEIKDLLLSCGYKQIVFLQNYRVKEPKNIHLLAY